MQCHFYFVGPSIIGMKIAAEVVENRDNQNEIIRGSVTEYIYSTFYSRTLVYF